MNPSISLIHYETAAAARFCPRCGSQNTLPESSRALFCGVCNFSLLPVCTVIAGAFVLHRDELILGVRGEEPSAGLLEIAGGPVDDGESVEEGLRRRIRETLNIDTSNHRYLLSAPENRMVAGKPHKTLSLFYVCEAADISGLRAANDLADWVTLAPDALDPARLASPAARLALAALRRQAPGADPARHSRTPHGSGIAAEFNLEHLHRTQEELERYYLAGVEQARQIGILRQSLDAVATQWPDLGAAYRVEFEERAGTTETSLHLTLENLWLAGRFWPRLAVKLLDCGGNPALEFRQTDDSPVPLLAAWPPDTVDAMGPRWRIFPNSRGLDSAGQPLPAGLVGSDEWHILRALARYLAQTLAAPRAVPGGAADIDAGRWRALAGRLSTDLDVAEALSTLGRAGPGETPPPTAVVQKMGGPLAGDGWHAPELSGEGVGYRWMGNTARTVLAIAAQGPLRLSVEGLSAMHPETLDTLSISANGVPLAGGTRTGPGPAWHYQAKVPETALRGDGLLLLVFETRKTLAPNQTNPASRDARQLGVSVKSIALAPWEAAEAQPPTPPAAAPEPEAAPSPPPGAAVVQDMSDPVIGEGWHAPERSGSGIGYRWIGKTAQIVFKIAAQGPLRLTVEGLSAMHPEVLYTLSISANGVPLMGRPRLSPGPTWHYKATVPETALNESGLLVLSFKAMKTLAPNERNPASRDTRQLSVSIKKITLAPAPPQEPPQESAMRTIE